jgi:TonB family protein
MDLRKPPVRITQAMLREHVPPVRFTPTRFAREGNYRVVYKVLLDHRGKVDNVELLTSSGDIRLDKAVEEALRAARPFPAGAADFTFSYSGTVTQRPAPREQPAGEAAPAEPAPEPAPEG